VSTHSECRIRIGEIVKKILPKKELKNSSVVVTKQKIVDAALAIAAKKGFEQATTAEIARKAGVAEGSIYNYFRTKDDLLIYTVSQFADSFLSTLSRVIEQEKNPLAKLNRLISFHIHFFTRKGNVFQIIYGKRPGAKVQMARILQVTVAPYASLIERIVKEGIELGYLERVNPQIMASSLLGGMQLTLLRRFFDLANYPPDEAIDDIKRIYLQGVMKQK
jgi:TetR/AcrR family fatty acid metabolism transcriptional regulator